MLSPSRAVWTLGLAASKSVTQAGAKCWDVDALGWKCGSSLLRKSWSLLRSGDFNVDYTPLGHHVFAAGKQHSVAGGREKGMLRSTRTRTACLSVPFTTLEDG